MPKCDACGEDLTWEDWIHGMIDFEKGTHWCQKCTNEKYPPCPETPPPPEGWH